MRRVRLSGRVGAGLDPCAAMQVQVALEDGQEKEIVFILGAARGEDQARQLVQRFRGAASAEQALEGVWHYWSRTLGAVYVETPDPAVNFLANGWLIYQTLACRMWAQIKGPWIQLSSRLRRGPEGLHGRVVIAVPGGSIGGDEASS